MPRLGGHGRLFSVDHAKVRTNVTHPWLGMLTLECLLDMASVSDYYYQFRDYLVLFSECFYRSSVDKSTHDCPACP
jgi:hypothetical protein